ncbi:MULTISPECIES: hypothetical protein [Nocardia]|uniref:hypothetical protein n=1 Tax=Nocardia TaxID=1817 RepID=UPI000FD71ED5|nr:MULTISPECIES: hypothetical protein [Nocardia]MBF6185116.1 hypothetical protein [Nocardia farcinica]MBF6310952.1 hypothetical protein [Nocardia farcinica]MBF6409888.1 hypothetical protein [Nocardia farcinica]UEX21743.1 hypothetical protein LMJ57_22535 [Nocardia farcinica]
MSTPNLKLQQRREATPSPTVAGRSMTRAELAEAVNDHLWWATGRRRELDAHTIARYERGAVRWPGKDYRQALCAVLHATETELGFAVARRTPAAERRDPLAVNLFSPFDPEHIPSDYLTRSKNVGRVGRSDVDKVRYAVAAAAAAENLHGGGSAADTAAHHLRVFAPLLPPPPHGRRSARQSATSAVSPPTPPSTSPPTPKPNDASDSPSGAPTPQDPGNYARRPRPTWPARPPTSATPTEHSH